MPVRGIGRHGFTHQPKGSDSISPLTGDLDFGNNSAKNVKNINGTDGINFDNSNVGIGIASPANKLHVRTGPSLGVTPWSGAQFVLEQGYADYGGVNILASDTKGGSIVIGNPSNVIEGGCQYRNPNALSNPDQFIFYTTGWTPRMVIDGANGGNVGIGLSNPGYKLDVSGDIHCTGKLTSDGGNDPAYVLYDYQTRKSIVELIKKEVPPSKLGGAVLFFNGERQSLELFIPLKGEFRSLNGELLEKTDPITQTFEVEQRYYFDEETGEVKSYEVKKYPRKYKLKEGYRFDNITGKFKKVVKEKVGGKEKEVEIEVEKEEAIEVAKRE